MGQKEHVMFSFMTTKEEKDQIHTKISTFHMELYQIQRLLYRQKFVLCLDIFYAKE